MTLPGWTVVLFDLDGTLVDTIPLILGSFGHAYREVLGREADLAECRTWIGRPLAATFAEASPAHADALVESYTLWHRANFAQMIRRFDGMTTLLADLREAGVTVGVATSKRRASAQATLASAGLDGVPVLAAVEDTPKHKPEPEPLWFAAQSLGVAPSDCVYVGDAVVDVLAAKAAGMAAIAVTWGAGTPTALAEAGPSEVVDTVPALSGLLLG